MGCHPCRTGAEPASYEARSWAPTEEHAAGLVGSNAFIRRAAEGDTPAYQAARDAEDVAAKVESEAQCGLLRDIFGLYFAPPGCEGVWVPVGPTRLPLLAKERWCVLPTPRPARVQPEWLSWNGGLVR